MEKTIHGSLNNNTKTLYIVNHKVANTTIVQVLRKHGYTGRRSIKVDPTNLNYIFTFVRNPYERLLSRYTHIKSYFKTTEDRPTTLVIGGHVLKNLKSYFDYYDIESCEDNFDFPRFVKFTQNNFDDHWEPQTNKFIRQVISLDNIDFVGKLENFQQDFNKVCDKIGIPQQQLPHVNKSKHKHYTEYYDDETRQIVAEIYAKDIERFGYKFGD